MFMKKMIDIVEELVSQGHKITWRVRTDGGIIVKSIDGQVFHDLTSGNKVARSMVVGGELPMSQITQRQFNVNKYIKLKEGEVKSRGDIDKELEKKLRRVQRIRRKYGRVEEGKISKKKLRWYVKEYGKERAKEYLESRERYYMGYANKDNVEFLAQAIERMGLEQPKYKNEADSLAAWIRAKADTFREDWIAPCYDVISGSPSHTTAYNHLTVEEKVKKINEIIGR